MQLGCGAFGQPVSCFGAQLNCHKPCLALPLLCSTKREPLGHGYVRGHVIPDGLGTTLAFGRAIHAKVGFLVAGPHHTQHSPRASSASYQCSSHCAV